MPGCMYCADGEHCRDRSTCSIECQVDDCKTGWDLANTTEQYWKDERAEFTGNVVMACVVSGVLIACFCAIMLVAFWDEKTIRPVQ